MNSRFETMVFLMTDFLNTMFDRTTFSCTVPSRISAGYYDDALYDLLMDDASAFNLLLAGHASMNFGPLADETFFADLRSGVTAETSRRRSSRSNWTLSARHFGGSTGHSRGYAAAATSRIRSDVRRRGSRRQTSARGRGFPVPRSTSSLAQACTSGATDALISDEVSALGGPQCVDSLAAAVQRLPDSQSTRGRVCLHRALARLQR